MPDPKHPLKVFLCHSSQDKPIVKEIYDRLLSEGWIDPWLDKERLKLGDDFDLEIEKAIASTDAVIAFISENAVKKTGYIQKELRLVYDAQMYRPDGELFTIPLRLEECEPPHRFKYWHWGDYFGEEKEKTYQSLLNSLSIIYERVQREETVEQARLKTEKEELQRLAKEKAEREAAEQVAREKAEKEAAEQKRRERLQQRAARSAATKEFFSKSLGNIKSAIPNTTSILRVVGFIGIIGVLFVFGSRGLETLKSALPNEKTSPAPTLKPTLTLTFTPQIPTITLTPEPTATQSQTLTPTPSPTEIVDDKGITMRLVPAGVFIMGSDDGGNDEKPVLYTYLEAFYMDIYEVTNATYKTCVDEGICTEPKETDTKTRSSYYESSEFDEYPVMHVDWYQSQAYCEWRNGSLPTEAQWEKAARGTDGRTFPWGEDLSCDKANYCEDDTTTVGAYDIGKSPYGMYDMAGNVWEWTADWYNAYRGNTEGNTNYGTTYRVIRGGSLSYIESSLRTFDRGILSPVTYSDNLGFRCAKSANP